MRKIQILMITFMGWCCALFLHAQEISYRGLIYRVSSKTEKTAELVGITTAKGDIVLPSSIPYNGTHYLVTSVGYQAFYKCTKVTSVDLNKVISIGTEAFYGCTELTSIKLKHVSSIGDGIFYNCTQLTSIDLGDVTSIGDGAFYNCTQLMSIDLQKVKSIGNGAFYNCSNLVSINLQNATSIGKNIFQKCTGLTSVDLGNVTSVGTSAFENCTGLTSVDLKQVTSIGTSAFKNCTGLTSVDLKQVTLIDNGVFYGCSGLIFVDCGKITSIGTSAFENCTGLISIDLKNVTSIGSSAFENCSSLTSIDLKNVTSIGNSAFYNCEGLTSVNLKKVTSISAYAFSACFNIRKVYVPHKAPYQDHSFEVQTPILIPSGSLPYYQNGWDKYHLIAYDFTEDEMDYKITSESKVTAALVCLAINRPSGYFIMPKVGLYNGKKYDITEIGANVFEDCKELTTFDTNQVKAIRKSSFEGCALLDSIILRNVKTIEADAFKACTNLKTILAGTTVPPFVETESVFESNVYLDAILYVPTGCQKAYEEALQWKKFWIEESDELTGLENIPSTDAHRGNIYDLNGRLAKSNTADTKGLQPGIYIMNGKKVMIK